MIHKTVSVLVIITFCLISNGRADNYVQKAWQVWAENDHQKVEEYFKKAIDENIQNVRAHLGLSLLYELQKKNETSWSELQEVLKIVPNSYPYLYAAWLMPTMRENYDLPDSSIINILKDITKKSDEGGILRAMANERLGNYYEGKGKFAVAKKFFNQLHAIDKWKVIGPFDNISASGFDKTYAPENEFDESIMYLGKNDIPAQWFEINTIRNDYWIDFRRYFAFREAIFYANNFIYSPDKKVVQFRIGTSGSLKAMLNDELLIAYFDENNNDLDTYIIETELQKGWNRVLIKCGYSEINRCNFMLRITDAEGNTINNITVDTNKQSYRSKPGAQVKIIDNFAERFFREKIKQNPDYLENYIYLAHCYLRNDKAIEAELVLKEAINLAPTCVLPYVHILEAYQRGEKNDEKATTIEKILKMDEKIPRILAYKINVYLDNEDFDNTEKFLQKLQLIIPESEYYYEFLVNFYLAKKEYDKLIEVNQTAFKKFPKNWTFTYLESVLSSQVLRNNDKAISVLEEYLSNHFNIAAFTNLADLYLKTSKVDKWKEIYDHLIRIQPSAVGYYYQVANTFNRLQNFEVSEKYMRDALSICPNSSTYWGLLAENYRAMDNKEKAIEAYQTALQFNRTNYEVREKLRKLRGKKPIFEHFDQENINKLIDSALTKEFYPNFKGIILLRNANRVVYPKGASESSEEFLVRVFNKRGIDDFKEYAIRYNEYIEGLTVEKAVVIKKDRSEIKADIYKNLLVFKSLEEDDFIYIKWKIKNYYDGKLSNHFWDKFYFNGFYPMDKVKYSLLVPENFEFNYSVQNLDIETKKKKTEDGILYSWEAVNVPSLGYEYGMPVKDDVSKILYISSIRDWSYMVDWYSDLASTKTRSSYEIKETVNALFKNKGDLSQLDKIKTIYNYITENIRYSSVAFRQSGLIPQKARDVLVNKIGDCKDTSTLCIAMLKELDIDAHYVLVNTRDEGQNSHLLPSISFNHCITAVKTKDGYHYLDLTANNFPFGSVPDMDINGFALQIEPGTKEPHYISNDNFISRDIHRVTKVEVLENNHIQIESKSSQSGAISARLRYGYRHKAPNEREILLTELLNNEFPNIKLKLLSMDNLDDLSPKIEYTYEGEVPNYITEAGSFMILAIPWRDKLKANQGLSYEKRRYNYTYWPRTDVVSEEMEIKIPVGYELVEVPADLILNNPIADYTVTYSFDDGVLKAQRRLVNKKIEVELDEYEEFKTFYNNAAREDTRQILIRKIN